MKKIIRLRMTIKDINNVTLYQGTVYGVQLDTRTIKVEGRYFKAGRKAGFGKSAYIYEFKNGKYHKVVIDKMEEVA